MEGMQLSISDLLTVSGLAVVITIIVQLAKGLVEERFVPLFAVAVGVVLAVVASVVLQQYGPEAVAQAVLTGFLGGASAIGIYSLQKPAGVLKGK